MKTRSFVLFAAPLLALTVSLQANPITNVIPDAARPIPLSAVRLTGGPLKHAQDLDAKYLLALEPDRMRRAGAQGQGLWRLGFREW